jgi:catechol 2,3-dioxygenase-like lactoylglutathione lyase family enzyme
MNLEFLATVAIITPDPASSRKLYVETLGLRLQGEGDGYHHSEQIPGCKSLRDLAALPSCEGVLRNRPVARGAASAPGQHRV